MRHHPVSRILATVLALWLAVCLAEPMQLHTCAMHGGLTTGRINGVKAHGHGPSAEHFANVAGGGDSHGDQNSDRKSPQCSCLGDCSTGRSPLGIAAAGVSLPTVAIVARPQAEFEYASPALVATRFLFPFSNGPPTSSSRA